MPKVFESRRNSETRSNMLSSSNNNVKDSETLRNDDDFHAKVGAATYFITWRHVSK